MPTIVVGRLQPETVRLNEGGETRWIKGDIILHPNCRQILSEIHQKRLPFTHTTGKVLPKGFVILTGELTSYRIPKTDIDWKTLEVKEVITEQSPTFQAIGLPFIEVVRKIAKEDPEVLEQLGSAKLLLKQKIVELVGKQNQFADRLIDIFGDNAYQKLVENPWKMIHFIPYFTMKQADAVAQKLGIPLDDERRFQEHFRYLLEQAFENRRDTYMSYNEFMAIYYMNFTNDMTADEYKDLVNQPDPPVIRTRLGYHPAHFFYAEKASFKVVRQSQDISVPVTEEEEQLLQRVIANEEITLTEEQYTAAKLAFHTPMHIIKGGPGTGKTTVLNTILKKLMLLTGSGPADEFAPFLLVAPTGKAAYRMWEQTGISAHTAHSAFGILPDYGCVDVQETAHRLSHIRYIVIDEASMLDTMLFGDMCRVMLAMDHLPFLLVVGDEDQLQPVSHGQVFKDLIAYFIKKAPEQITTLNLLKRQAADSHIPELASYIRQGQFPDADWFADKPDISFVPTNMNNLQATLTEQVLKPKLDEIETIQILTPYRNGSTPDTIYALNELCEPLFNPDTETSPEVRLKTPPRIFKEGDKVINRINRSETVINGSIGIIQAIHNQSRDVFAWTIEVLFESGTSVTYAFDEWKYLEPAYAITIHASQGSEYERVVTCIVRGTTGFLNRNLLYVAVTRASKQLVLMGDIYEMKRIAATEEIPRKTALRPWLLEQAR